MTLRVASIASAIATVLGIAIAYLLAKGKFRGRALIEAIVTLPIVIPPTVMGYFLLTALGVNSAFGRAWEKLTGSAIVFTPTAAVIAATIAALPFVVRASRAAIEEVDDRAEAAMRVAGHPEWKVALLVTFPLARRGILAGVALAGARALGEFGATVMIAGNIPGRTQTLPIAVFDSVQAGDIDQARNGSLLLVGIAIAALIAMTVLSRRRS
ncbi:MAG: molybdate ABC transporter permease subunit [Actinobacteria bacterium]|nr:molybdate ABC transporter permease subunit [Actinomycetota bacterium]